MMGTVSSKPSPKLCQALETNAACQRLETMLLPHALARALQSGSPDTLFPRPPLPMEIVLQILRLACCVKLHPSRNLTISPTEQLTRIISYGPPESCLWFSTPPFTWQALNKVGQLRLTTTLRSPGNCGMIVSFFIFFTFFNVTTQNDNKAGD